MPTTHITDESDQSLLTQYSETSHMRKKSTEPTNHSSSSLNANKSGKAEDHTKDNPKDAANVAVEQPAGLLLPGDAQGSKQYKKTHLPSPQLLNYLTSPATEDPYSGLEDSGWANAISQRVKDSNEELDALQKECEMLAAANNK